MLEPEGNGHFHIFTAVSTTMRGSSTGQHRERPNFLKWEACRRLSCGRTAPAGSYRPSQHDFALGVRGKPCAVLKGVSARVLHHEQRRHSAAGLYGENTAVDVDL